MLKCTFPATYPAELPLLSFESSKGVDEKQKVELMDLARATAEENLGMPMVYSIAERIREWLVENNIKPSDGSAYDDMLRRQAAELKASSGGGKTGALSREADPSIKHKYVASATEADEVARKKRDGTPVTREAFLAWRDKFDREMDQKARDDEAAGIIPEIFIQRSTGRLTGRQLFENEPSLAAAIDAEDDDAAAVDVDYTRAAAGSSNAAGAGSAPVFDESAFAGDDDVDLDDIDDEDEEDSDYEDADVDDDDDDDEDDDE